ncbi:hypothetical protein B0T17DRAFT_639555, partial [Bombardia bombarda]
QKFPFRTRIICATATPIDNVYPNVLRLQVQSSIVLRLIPRLVAFLPSTIRTWFDASYPEWNLPSNVILKKEKKDWQKEFDNEKAAYTKLRPLQGVIIPKFFGELLYDNTKAFLMSDIGGASLDSPEGALLEVADFRRMLHQTLIAFTQFRITLDDLKLGNFHLTGDKIMIVDLENLNEDLTDKDIDLFIRVATDFLTEEYESWQYQFWKDGHIEIAS